MSFVELKDIDVSYDGKQSILKELSIAMEKGELVSLLGPSGCGKTTTLRVIAGLIKPTSGDFMVNNKNLTSVPVHKRQFGMVFQSYALFPHLTVEENVAFGLRLRKEKKEVIDKKVEEMLSACGLDGFSKRYPKQLSGGQRQRVALARALVVEPDLLLLDEPLSNLDAKLRVAMRIEIKRIQQKLGITTVFVTHDQEECFSISDRVAIMNRGIIEQYDTPEMIYRYPKTEFVARFIGFENFFKVKKKDLVVMTESGVELHVSERYVKLTGDLMATIRPEDISISSAGLIKGRILVRTFLGKSYQYEVETEIGSLLVNGDDHQMYEVGQEIGLDFSKEKIILLNK